MSYRGIFQLFFYLSMYHVLQTLFRRHIYACTNRFFLRLLLSVQVLCHKQNIPSSINVPQNECVYLLTREQDKIFHIFHGYLHLPILSLPLVFVKCFPLSHFHGSQQLFQWVLLIPRLSCQVRFRILHPAPMGFGGQVILGVTDHSTPT